MTATQMAKSILSMQDPDKSSALMATADIKPSILLKGDNPRLIERCR